MSKKYGKPKDSYTNLATSLTHVRLLSGMHTRVYGQGGALNELLATSWVVANVWANTAVDTLCERLALCA